MKNTENHDYAMERRLRALNPELHRRFTDAVFALQYNLSHYKLIFPEYTDHSNLHSMTVIDFCNRLIGSQIQSLNPDELYVLLMGCYFHDTGMGITLKDYQEFSKQIDFRGYFDTHSRDNLPEIIRSFHNEYSGLFLRKYAELFELPSEEHLFAVIQIARGHRKTDLLDEKEYPAALRMPDGNTVCLPYLSALIRLADEIDVAAARNPRLLYDIESLTDEVEIIENKKVRAVRELAVTEDAFILYVDRSDEEILGHIRAMVVKMQKTLDYCRRVALERCPYVITQQRVRMEEVG
ncbi:MAG: hypothetical protein IJS11_00345 [Oscillospiraceae bacterium]|nr:hypothetical protein [Oscillospiraceae bacterium]